MVHDTNRRGVLGLGLAGLASPALTALPGDAELIVRNARVAHDKIKDIKVVRTVTGGRTVFEA